ncbi:hypothetical protein [Neobacillus niacini]|uniref:hypothetical protein n=1 Tax=Neobacillus niacini TaxID=86668 RepID=UPI003982EE03
MGIRRPNCEVLRHEATTIEILQIAGTFTYFTDLTENHYKAMIGLRITSQATGAGANGQLIVTARDGTNTIIDFSGSVTVQIEDALSVSLRSTGLVGGNMSIIKDFCICCTDQGEVRRHEGTFEAENTFLFTDLTENHYKAMFVILGNGTGDTTSGTAIVTPRIGTATTINLPPRQQAVIQVEDAESVLFSGLRFQQEGGQDNNIQIIKDFCISCP